MVFCAVVFKLLVWCGAEGYVSSLQDAAASSWHFISTYKLFKFKKRKRLHGVTCGIYSRIAFLLWHCLGAKANHNSEKSDLLFILCVVILLNWNADAWTMICTQKNPYVLPFLAVFIITEWPGHSACSTSSLPSETFLCHSDAQAIGKAFYLYASLNRFQIFYALFLSFASNLTFVALHVRPFFRQPLHIGLLVTFHYLVFHARWSIVIVSIIYRL